MCGIVGFLRTDGERAQRHVVEDMRDALAHRGPDGAGTFLDGPLALGHRRLAIIDLSSAAQQPMVSSDERWVLVFNGEIYNFRNLRNVLEQEGWVFRTQSDTEVLLVGAQAWGVEKITRLIDGMASFALWDCLHRTLYLVRDRYGTKPLYIWRCQSQLAFASEVKAFLKNPDFSVKLNKDALREYMTFQNVFREHTLFKDVEQVPPGTIMVIDDEKVVCNRYWDFDFTRRSTIASDEATAHLTDLMRAAVTRQMISDVPLGAYLSGGMDSGSIVALASREMPRLQTFTAGFEMSRVNGMEASFDERRSAEFMAYRFRTEHYEQVMNAGDLRWSLPRVVWHLEDLRLGMSYPNYYIARLASKFVKVCLSGAGGDEIFGGYPWRYYRVFKSLDRSHYLKNYYDFWQRLTNQEQRKKLFNMNDDGEDDMFDIFSSVFDAKADLPFDQPEDHIAASLYFECKTFLSGLLLVGDKLSMAHGLEERFPFLDNELVEFASSLPIGLKLGDLDHMLAVDEDAVRKKLLAQEYTGAGKNVLRQAMSQIVPAEVLSRPKQGFSSPEASWYRGENADYVREMLLGGDLVSEEFLSREFITDCIEQHMSGKSNNRLIIWSFLSFEQWCRTFLRGDRIDG